MKRPIIFALSVIIATATTPGLAQTRLASQQAAALGEVFSNPATELIAAADHQAGLRRWASARRTYWSATSVQRAAGVLPDVPLRRIANLYYLEKRYDRAISVLDTLASDAARRGSLVVQAEAALDAAYLSGRLGDRTGFERRTAELRQLLASPFFPAADKQRLLNRLGG